LCAVYDGWLERPQRCSSLVRTASDRRRHSWQ